MVRARRVKDALRGGGTQRTSYRTSGSSANKNASSSAAYLFEVRRQLVPGKEGGLTEPETPMESIQKDQDHQETDEQRAQEEEEDLPPGHGACEGANITSSNVPNSQEV